MREIFSDRALISCYVEVEVALARAQARCGVIPAEAAEQIATKSNVASLDFDLLRHETDIVGYPMLPLVHQLVKQCDDAGRYIHWGATTQDIMDTAVVLQTRDALTIIKEDINELRGILAKLAKKYRDTPMAGRTHLQQALPVTFAQFSIVTQNVSSSSSLAFWLASSRVPRAPWRLLAKRDWRSRRRFARNWA